MLVKDVMTEKVVAIGSKMPIADAHALMEQRNIRHFPIVEEGDSRLVGIISDRDIRLVGSEHPQARRGYPGTTCTSPPRTTRARR